MKPLSNRQKAGLAKVARRAFDYLTARGQLSGIDCDAWRHDECEREVGKPGLRECDNGDYNKLLAHFSDLAGETGAALKAILQEQAAPKRIAEAVLIRELSKAGLPLAYAEKISRDKHGVGVLDCNARQTWHLVYSIRTRSKAKRRSKPEPGTRNPEPSPLPASPG